MLPNVAPNAVKSIEDPSQIVVCEELIALGAVELVSTKTTWFTVLEESQLPSALT